MKFHDRVNLRNTHPTLYWQTMTFALMSVALAASYWFGPAPAFHPYDIPIPAVAAVFGAYGVWQIFSLSIHHLLMVRIGMASAFVFMGAWGFANTIQGIAGKASFTLPIILLAIAASHLKLLTESPVNPMTRRKAK